jgi:hypothetical protein
VAADKTGTSCHDYVMHITAAAKLF